MFLKKKAIFLDIEISNKELKKVQNSYENGNFREAKKYLKDIDSNKLEKRDEQEYDKLRSLLSLDIWGVIAGVTLLIVVMYFFINYSNI